MKIALAICSLTLIALEALASPHAMAQEAGDFYGGLSIGRSLSTNDDQHVLAALASLGLKTISIANNNRGAGFALFAGYEASPHWGLEAGVFDLGSMEFTSVLADQEAIQGQYRAYGANLDLVATLPLGNRFSATGRIGVQYARTRESFAGNGAVAAMNPTSHSNRWGTKFGVGLQYAVNPSFSIRAQFERYNLDDGMHRLTGVNLYSVGFVLPFGRGSH
ncbi:MAG: outer membrane beta-barrel protein [Burkholderiales bacterium]|nr:outer membrane beta-barrel protein [Burkholderiales bacterium]MDE2397081.1 outer membrane beta-barrel protein [Burkholderiales bacterium]MDE2452300.1 outer membrane beta-barrel protein [Burkholderiales bacterium]